MINACYLGVQPSSFHTCPICGAAVPRGLIQDHAEFCIGAPGKLRSDTPASTAILSAAALQQPESTAQHLATRHDADQAKPSACSQPKEISKSANALSMLMAEQRERSQVHVFFLEHLPNGSWQAYWHVKGSKAARAPAHSTQASSGCSSREDVPAPMPVPSSQAVWTATTQMSGSIMGSVNAPDASTSKAKITVQLQTNVAAGAQDELKQLTGNQRSGSFRGSPSLLKSALQKNVRLCRAAPAVR